MCGKLGLQAGEGWRERRWCRFGGQCGVCCCSTYWRMMSPVRPRSCEDVGEDAAQVVEDVLGEYFSVASGHKDQIYVHQKNAMSSVPNVVVVAYRLTMLSA
jgi:hypothetical protein